MFEEREGAETKFLNEKSCELKEYLCCAFCIIGLNERPFAVFSLSERMPKECVNVILWLLAEKASSVA
jgi:hypothetical protein